MKKVIIAAICCMFAICATAQVKGNFEMGGEISFENKNSKGVTGDYREFYFSPWVEYFITDTWSAGFNLLYQGNKYSRYTDNWFGFGPSLSRRIPITEKLSYTPYIYCDFWWGNESDSATPNEKVFSLESGLCFISFKYNITNHWGIYFDCGEIAYSLDKSKKTGFLSNSFIANLITEARVSVSYTF